MRKFSLLLSLLLLLCSLSKVSAQGGQLEAKPASEDEAAVIGRGADLFDKGKYDEAIEQFNKVLVKNPDCAQAIYEMANTYYAGGDSKKAMEYVQMGLKYRSPNLPLFYTLAGGIEDDNKNPEAAIEDYKKAIALAPKFHYAYFNLGITQRRMGKTAEALDNFKQAVKLNPGHPSTNFQIADIYRMKNQKIPAFMAYMSYLYFANDDDKRIPTALEEIRKLTNAETNSSGGTNISLSMDSSEGDFFASELMMGLNAASGIDKAVDSITNTKLSDYEKELRNYEAVIRIISLDAEKDHSQGFAMQFYGAYFSSMQKSGNTKTFCHVIGRHINEKETIEWFESHANDQKTFGDWEKTYFSKK
ncbi:MAG: tetratricopeptide repeat protein [Ignavibacteriota bacterium]